MIPQQFTDANVILKSPEGHDAEKYGLCEDLPIFFDRVNSVMTSIWKPTEEELKILNEGGGVALRVIAPNGQHPPVHLVGVDLKDTTSEIGGKDEHDSSKT